MGSWTSRPAWDVWWMNTRYRFNQIQVNDEYWGVPGCFGARKASGQRVMNKIFIQKLERQHLKLEQSLQNKEQKLTKMRKESQRMLEQESGKFPGMTREKAETLKTNPLVINFVKTFLRKNIEIQKQKDSVNVVLTRIAKNEEMMTKCVEVEGHFEDSDEPLDFGAHFTAVNSALEGKLQESTNPENEAAIAKADATLDELRSANGSVIDNISINDKMIANVINMMFDPTARAREFADIKEQESASHAKGKNVFASQILDQTGAVSASGMADDDVMIFHSDSSRAGAAMGRGQARNTRGGGRGGFNTDNL